MNTTAKPRKVASRTRVTRKNKKNGKKRRLIFTLPAFCLSLLAIAGSVFWLFGVQFYTVVSNSMSPTLLAGIDDKDDKLLCSLMAFKNRQPRRWEAVVFHTPTAEALRIVAGGGRMHPHQEVTVKRAVGLPGEEVAIRRGDIWTRPAGRGDFVRQVKPDRIQRALWIPVYDENFSVAGVEEVEHFWSREGEGGVRITDAGGTRHLLISAGDGIVSFRFRPTVRVGKGGMETLALPGIPDRYLLPQRLWFKCSDPECNALFEDRHDGAQVQARCPRDGQFLFEEDVQIYTYNSGLVGHGPGSAWDIQNGDLLSVRVFPYIMVSDLRLRSEMQLGAGARIAFSLMENEREDIVEITAGQRIRLNGTAVGAAMAAERWFGLEFYRVDGELRLFIDSEAIPLPPDKAAVFPKENVENTASGARFSVQSGLVRMRRLALDRDIHYISGYGNDFMPQFITMGESGCITLSQDAFFPLGDNTDLSLDARAWGPVPLALLRGNVLAITQPSERRRLIPIPRE